MTEYEQYLKWVEQTKRNLQLIKNLDEIKALLEAKDGKGD